MITVKITNQSLRVTGHAARPPGVPPGQNIICAAVSALTLTLIEGLRMVAGIWIMTEENEGDVCIRWEHLNDKAHTLLDTWLIGMRCIQGSYGQGGCGQLKSRRYQRIYNQLHIFKSYPHSCRI